MKILILCCYYDRPNMVRFALNSIKNQSYDNWELIFVDDSSKFPGKPIVEEILGDYLSKVKFYHTNDPEKKEGNGESIFGKYWNIASLNSDSDISIMLCDDDALTPNYLQELSKWYENNPNQNYSYCHLSTFNPYEVRSLDEIKINLNYGLNHKVPINPYCMLDASQVSWRTDAVRMNNVRFPFPQTSSLDADFYKQLFEIYGECYFNGIVGQYKGIHCDQLGLRLFEENKVYTVNDLSFIPL